MNRDKVTIKIPRQLYNKLRTIIEGSGFSSVNEFIVYVLRDLVALHKEDEDKLTAEEIKLLKERLKKLGYL
ncbi:MAG: CopG family transcriptional regulator [candidate division Zixibacteria bacterium SM23_81]|nr:MAG: CopG family transcriptional regulator [candidate division Zixibacteria bacterium SM23_81]